MTPRHGKGGRPRMPQEDAPAGQIARNRYCPAPPKTVFLRRLRRRTTTGRTHPDCFSDLNRHIRIL